MRKERLESANAKSSSGARGELLSGLNAVQQKARQSSASFSQESSNVLLITARPLHRCSRSRRRRCPHPHPRPPRPRSPSRASSRSRGTGRAAASCPRRRLSSQAAGGLGRSWPGAFGRPKNKSGALPAHRARDAARAARGRRAVRQICVFEAAAPRSGGRAARRGARARRARVASGAGPPGGARGAAPAGGRARTGRWRRPARRGAGAGRRHFRSICVLFR